VIGDRYAVQSSAGRKTESHVVHAYNTQRDDENVQMYEDEALNIYQTSVIYSLAYDKTVTVFCRLVHFNSKQVDASCIARASLYLHARPHSRLTASLLADRTMRRFVTQWADERSQLGLLSAWKTKI